MCLRHRARTKSQNLLHHNFCSLLIDDYDDEREGMKNDSLLRENILIIEKNSHHQQHNHHHHHSQSFTTTNTQKKKKQASIKSRHHVSYPVLLQPFLSKTKDFFHSLTQRQRESRETERERESRDFCKMGEEAVLLRNVGLGSVADVLDEFYRQVLELNNEMSGKVRF